MTLGIPTEAQLNTKDSFFLGRFAYMNGHFHEAKKWLDLAALQIATESHNETSVSQSQLSMMLNVLKKKVGTFNDLDEAETIEEDLSKYKLGVVPPKTQDREKMVTEGDRLNFAALCRGVDLLPASVTKNLNCYLTTKDDPYYKLHPLQVLSLSIDSTTTHIAPEKNKGNVCSVSRKLGIFI